MQSTLGQVIHTDFEQGLAPAITDHIRKYCIENTGFLNTRKISVVVGSQNVHKINAATQAVQEWAATMFTRVDFNVITCETSSGVNPQPAGHAEITEGVNNRLWKLRDKLHNERDTLIVYIALENGIIEEKVKPIKNSSIFEYKEGHAWVDRCHARVLVKLGFREWNCEAVSVGVTVPKECVLKSKNTGWMQTAGYFIAEQFQCSDSDWHSKIAGVSREEIMMNAIKAALGMGSRFHYAI